MGVDATVTNNEGQKAIDLCTSEDAKQALEDWQAALYCPNCKRSFENQDLDLQKYYCATSDNFFCQDCCIRYWVYEFADSVEKEKLVCRSQAVHKHINDTECELRQAIESNSPNVLAKVLEDSANVEICPKLLKEASDAKEA